MKRFSKITMPVKTKSYFRQHFEGSKKYARDRVNYAAKVHKEVSEQHCPVDKGNLKASHRIAKQATAQDISAVVQVGGIEVNGVFVDYTIFVDRGHATVNGGYVPGVFFWEAGEEAGKNALGKSVQSLPVSDE